MGLDFTPSHLLSQLDHSALSVPRPASSPLSTPTLPTSTSTPHYPLALPRPPHHPLALHITHSLFTSPTPHYPLSLHITHFHFHSRGTTHIHRPRHIVISDYDQTWLPPAQHQASTTQHRLMIVSPGSVMWHERSHGRGERSQQVR